MTDQTITAEDLQKFTTHYPREILFYLHQLINDGELISVVFDGGSETVLTVLLDVDETRNILIFDWGGDELANRKLLRSDRNFFVCAPHGVKNQFVTGPVFEVTYRKRPAFATTLPDHFTRLQRREFFRLVLPLTRRPLCTMAQPDGQNLELPVIDISIGGIAMELSPPRAIFEVGQHLPGSLIELKNKVVLEVDLEVRNICEIKRGKKMLTRIGCQFVTLNHTVEHQLQRFITDVQREERMRLGA